MKKFVVVLFLLIPVLTLAQENSARKKAYYFYGENCPHCKKVETYFQENGIYDKYDITSLEFSNSFNARLLLKFGDAFNDPNRGGVPAIAFGDKFITGDQPIIDNFVKEIDAADNANGLPDPDKIVNTNNQDSQRPSSVPPSGTAAGERNKKNYFPVIIGALIASGIGALVYVNRKKS